MSAAEPTGRDELRQVCAAIFSKEHGSAELRRAIDSDLGYTPRLWERLCGETGLIGVGVPERLGGSGGDFADLAVLMEEAGRVLYTGPLLGARARAVEALLGLAADVVAPTLLGPILDGTRLAAFTDTAALTAEETSAGWTVSGTAPLVVDGLVADVVLVAVPPAPGHEGPLLLAVDSDQEAVVRRPTAVLDLTHRYAQIAFSSATASLVSRSDATSGDWRTMRSRMLIASAAEEIGGARACLDMAVAYAKEREQFGRPIGAFQAVKHPIADRFVAIENARAALEFAVGLANDPEGGDIDELEIAASIAQACCADAFTEIAKQNIQVHGGMGFTWEHDAHLYLRRAKSAQLLWGSSREHRERVAELVGL